ncbi:uncharacterized protein LOC119643705 [Glossina fuscipes]|uniref:Uncharacterized protein LOC119643705 n=2 Tax=Nemorhina TaxID=44051 RepID=A0A9C6E0V0_9MUSC|nr:uncharacterized protein LOC119643705 [Glossina fuscipes]XP_037899067.1 uncharacterized protein LOC119643705 [Glossina fuscipes]XP_037899073.1 uncharacterized protein LOC119643705 [Glossina fuscipes]KAI9590099.1 hypothetical protein GQX74_008267 [Glossina fuscipes]
MSHSVTITRTTTSTTNTSYIVLNTGYLKTFSGLLKLFELLIGGAMVGIFGYYQRHGNSMFVGSAELFALLMSVTFMIGTFCLLLSCLTSLSTGGIISKTIYELIYHSVAAILLLAASINLVIELSDRRYKGYKQYDAYMAAGIMGLINTVLYFISAFLAHRSYRGI